MTLNARHLISLRKPSCWPKMYAFLICWIYPWSDLKEKVSFFSNLSQGTRWSSPGLSVKVFLIWGLIRCPHHHHLVFYTGAESREKRWNYRGLKWKSNLEISWFMVKFCCCCLAAKLYLVKPKLGSVLKQAGCQLKQNHHLYWLYWDAKPLVTFQMKVRF